MALRLIAGEGRGDGKPRLVAKKGALRGAPQESGLSALIQAYADAVRSGAPPSASNKYMGQTTLPGVPGVVQNPKEKK